MMKHLLRVQARSAGTSDSKDEKGVILILALAILVVLSGVALAFAVLTGREIKTSGIVLNDVKAYYIAEAGLAKARWAITTGGQAVGWGESDIAFGGGTYTVTTVDNGDTTYTFTSEGYIPDDTNPLVKRRVVEANIPFTVNFTNLALGAAASASSSQGASTPDNANDGDTGTRWTSSGGNGSWLAIDFGSAKAFDKAVINENGSKIATYTIQSSSDGTTWTAVSNPVETVNGSVRTVTFDSVTRRHARLFIDTTANRPSINEFEIYNVAGGGTPTLGHGKFSTAW